MVYLALADLVFAAHLIFILFVLFGILVVWRWPRLAWLHLPLAVWAVAIEFRIVGECPLTPLQRYLLRRAGRPAYEGGFIDHYFTPRLGVNLTPQQGYGIGLLFAGALVLAYALVFWDTHRRRQQAS